MGSGFQGLKDGGEKTEMIKKKDLNMCFRLSGTEGLAELIKTTTVSKDF